MERRKQSERPEDVSTLLAQLAEVHAGLSGIQVERRRLIADVQGRRGHARFSSMRVQNEEQRLVVRRSLAGREADESKLTALTASLATEKASHVQQVEEYGAALAAVAGERARLRKDVQALEKKRADLAHALPRVYARAYGKLVAQGVGDPIVDVGGGACVCGCAIDLAEEVMPTSCESCDRLLIAVGSSLAGGGGEPPR
jgi:hypothetical protein